MKLHLFFALFTAAQAVAVPVVQVTSPADGTVLPAGQKFTATANVKADPGHKIVKVEYVVWSCNLIMGSATEPPFDAEITPRNLFEKTSFSLIARATDDTGAATDSEPVWLAMKNDASYPPSAKPRKERFISRHTPSSGHEGIPSFAELSDGELLCVYYAGKYELSDDSAIYLTRLTKGADEWETPRRIIGGDDGVPRANPVLLVGKDGELTCFYSNSEGGRNFEYVRPYFRVSHDAGKTWGAEQRMPEPDFQYPTGTLFALKPVRLADGTILLPANRESQDPDATRGWYSLFYRSTDEGKTWTESEAIFSRPGNIQPTVQQLADGSLVALFRPRGQKRKLWRSTSSDGGKTWAPLSETSVDNPSSRSDFVVLPSGNLVLACNPDPTLRTPVSLLLSRDGGETWPVRRDIETGPGPSGYTAVHLSADGKIHVGYDLHRYSIKEVVVDEAWFDEPAKMIPYQQP